MNTRCVPKAPAGGLNPHVEGVRPVGELVSPGWADPPDLRTVDVNCMYWNLYRMKSTKTHLVHVARKDCGEDELGVAPGGVPVWTFGRSTSVRACMSHWTYTYNNNKRGNPQLAHIPLSIPTYYNKEPYALERLVQRRRVHHSLRPQVSGQGQVRVAVQVHPVQPLEGGALRL